MDVSFLVLQKLQVNMNFETNRQTDSDTGYTEKENIFPVRLAVRSLVLVAADV